MSNKVSEYDTDVRLREHSLEKIFVGVPNPSFGGESALCLPIAKCYQYTVKLVIRINVSIATDTHSARSLRENNG